MKSNCDDTRELMPDLAAGLAAATPEVKAHLESCTECAGKLSRIENALCAATWQRPGAQHIGVCQGNVFGRIHHRC